MKRTIPALILTGLMLAAMTSCQKDDDEQKPPTGTTTSTTSATGGTTNPLIKKACQGKGDITIDGQSDTIHAMEAILPPLNLYGVYTMGAEIDLSLQSGAKALPSKNTTFAVAGDPDKMPLANEMILSFYDSNNEMDYYAQSGTIHYNIYATYKVIKFSDVVFKSSGGATKTITFEAVLK